ncbi:MAG TPA: UvrD-helicase domain-containing protein, partial [Candidatus Aminicenantes bacterium]|nr:UvrD-helicase domain-containing protein [Candidatus Aminicenantes bacterium]
MDEKLLLLEASAGSGKTYALTNRFLRSLWKVLPEDPYRDSAKANAALSTLLAVTFTNKAAEEMSDRILKTLKELALQGDDSAFAARLREVLGSQGPVDVARDRKKALGIVELILSRMGDFRVTTIDSLMTSFVQSLSPELGLTPGFKISLDSQGTFQTTYRSFFAAQCEERWTEVESFLLQALFLGKLTGWSPEKSTRELIGWFFGFSLQQGDLKEPEDSPETVQRAIDEEWIGFRERMVPLVRRMEVLNELGFLKKNDSLRAFLLKL